jgi:hypothetical protein
VVAAAAALGISSQASAAYTTADGPTGSSLILNVFDTVTKESYSATLEVAPKNLTNGTFNGGASFTALAGNSTFTSLFADNNAANIRWEVVGGTNDASSGASPGDNIPWSLGFTAASQPATFAGNQQNFAGNKLNNWISLISVHQTGANSGLTTSSNATDLWNMNAAAAPFGGDFGGGTLPFAITGLLGASLSYFTATVNGAFAGDASTFSQIAGTWSLGNDGTLTWNTAAAVVPVPAAIWLLGSGLLGLVGVGRRRNSNASNANLAAA